MSSASIKISVANKKLDCSIALTGSKSESNRALIMQALSDGAVQVKNISEAADTVTLNNILGGNPAGVVNVGPAGTAMRFLTAFFPLQDGEVILTGSERMKQRPIGILVDALRTLGADIEYAEQEGFPPLRIKGPFVQKTDQVSIKGNISSQYISALLLIAPKLEQGLKLVIDGELTSKPYVEMTLAMMEQAGIRHVWKKNVISISSQPFSKAVISVEPDWSAASYWYAIAALAEEARLFLPGLNGYSLQGDSKITEIMANFGITSQFKDGGVYLRKEAKKLERKIFDFKECPDLAQTVIVCCAALRHDATFTGLETLKIKETDRVNALQTELAKIGVKLIGKNMTYKLDCSGLDLNRKISVATYDDHRMAMAFAPLALVMQELEIEDHLVVEKSYPDFWKHLEMAGFELKSSEY
ncbi:MAG: 3-phosphoshikimate 1-carboxyvinyltransferase [Pedobacter sp.]|jgi:3-phosphoshikimate 1-carboxyvinyltransferase